MQYSQSKTMSSAKKSIHLSRRKSVNSTINSIPKVEIYLDSQISSAMKNIKQKISQKNRQDSSNYLENFRHISLSQSITQDPTLIDNDIVTQYIQQIYDKYQIQDPLKDYIMSKQKQSKYPFSQQKQKQFVYLSKDSSKTQKKLKKRISINQNKIIDLKNKIKEQALTNQQQSTIKRNETPKQRLSIQFVDNDTWDFSNQISAGLDSKESSPRRYQQEVNSFNGTNQKKKGNLNPKKRLFIKTKSKALSINAANEQINILPQLSVKNSNTNQIETFRKNLMSTEGISKNQKVSEIYRYCFMCEQCLLEVNILQHEGKCKQLKQAYQYSLEKLDQILSLKIERIKNQIKNGKLLSIDQQTLSELQTKASNWINSINSQNPNRSLRYGQNNKYFQLRKSLNQNLLDSCNQIYKLHWFIRLKKNLQEEINFQLRI